MPAIPIWFNKATAWAIAAAFVFAGAAATAQMRPEQIRSVYERVSPAVCPVAYSVEITSPYGNRNQTQKARSVGVLVSPDGLVVTHGHMQIPNREPFNVEVSVGRGDDMRVYAADVLEKPSDVNLMFLQLRDVEERLPYIQFAERELEVGDELVLVGMLGDPWDLAPSTLVRRVGAKLDEPRTTYAIDEAIPFGFVTAPAADAQGRIVGLTGYDLTPQEGGELYVRSGHPLVYYTSLFRQYIANPTAIESRAEKEEGAWLGIFTQPLSDELAEYWGLEPTGGVVVSTIVSGSPAEQAGLKRGDVIKRLADTPVRARQRSDVLAFTRMVRERKPGEEVTLSLLRDGEPVRLQASLTDLPKSAREAAVYEDEVFGLTVREITPDLRLQLNLSDEVEGVIVSRVRPGSWANLAGMIPLAIIMNFGGHTVTDIESFKAAVEAVEEEQPQEVTVFCRVGPRTGFFRLEPRWEEAPGAAE